MESVQALFSSFIKENIDNKNLNVLVSDFVFTTTRKRLQRIKTDSGTQGRIAEIYEIFKHELISQELYNLEIASSVIDGIIKAVTYDESELLLKKLYEKEQLEKSIAKQKEAIREHILNSYATLEGDELTTQAICDLKLQNAQMLGILKETTTEAILTTIEQGSDIEETIEEITKSITYEAIKEGDFTKKRFLDIAKTVISATSEIADTDPAVASPLLYGAIKGTKDGISRAVDKFRHDLKYAPEEIEAVLGRELEEIKKEVTKVDEAYVNMIKEIATENSGASKKVMDEILKEELDSALAKMQRISNEALLTISERVDELKSNTKMSELKAKTSQKIESLKKEVEELKNSPKTKEVKAVGERAWERAKNMLDDALKTAKEAMNKGDKKE